MSGAMPDRWLDLAQGATSDRRLELAQGGTPDRPLVRSQGARATPDRPFHGSVMR